MQLCRDLVASLGYLSPGLKSQNALLWYLWYEERLDGSSSLWGFLLAAQGWAELTGRVTSKVVKHRIVSLWLYAAGMVAIVGNGEGP